MRLVGKVALVTGAARGIGKAIALAFAREGADVVVCDRDPCESVADEISARGRRALALCCDVSSASPVEACIAKTLESFGRLDVLVNNAGIARGASIGELDERAWDDVLGVNLKGVFLFSKAAAAHMAGRRTGVIISIASIAGMRGFAGSAAYCASKAGIINLTRALALELAPAGIRVNAIAPGIIRTEMTKGYLEDSKTRDSFIAQTPLGRLGEPEDVANAAVFLASDEASFVTGQTLVVDGGWTAK